MRRSLACCFFVILGCVTGGTDASISAPTNHAVKNATSSNCSAVWCLPLPGVSETLQTPAVAVAGHRYLTAVYDGLSTTSWVEIDTNSGNITMTSPLPVNLSATPLPAAFGYSAGSQTVVTVGSPVNIANTSILAYLNVANGYSFTGPACHGIFLRISVADDVVAAVDTNRVVTVFDVRTGSKLWTYNESEIFTTVGAEAADGVVVVADFAPDPFFKPRVLVFAALGYNSLTGEKLWTIPCTLYVGAGPNSTVLVVNSNTTGWNITSELSVYLRSTGTFVGAVPLPPGKLSTVGAVQGDLVLLSDQLTYVTAVRVALGDARVLWTIPLHTLNGFKPILDAIYLSADDKFVYVSGVNNSSPSLATNVTALNSTTGAVESFAAFSSQQQFVTLGNGLVAAFDDVSSYFTVHNFAAASDATTPIYSSDGQVASGSLQVVSSGAFVAVFWNGTAAKFAF
jgi:hypothetical protein